MNISILRKLLKTKKISQREISAKIGMTQAGFSQAIMNGDFKVSVLEKISDALKVPITVFFEDGLTTKKIIGDNNIVNTGTQKNSNNSCAVNAELALCQKENEYLKKEIALKDKIIKMLEEK